MEELIENKWTIFLRKSIKNKIENYRKFKFLQIFIKKREITIYVVYSKSSKKNLTVLGKM